MSCNQPLNNCGCNKAPKCAPVSDCACKVKINSDCVDNVKSVFECLNIESNLTLTQTLTAIDQAICALLESQQSNFTLQNVGSGQTVYKGLSSLGAKQIKSLLGSDSITVVSNGANTEVSFAVNEEWLVEQLGNYTASNVGDGEGIFKQLNAGDFEFKSLVSADGTVTITGSTDTVNLAANIDIQAGDGVTVTGSGTSADPYIISAEEVTLQNGVTTTVVGNGVSTPYSVETVNLQKTITVQPETPYVLQASDDKYTIFVTNGGSSSTPEESAIIRVPNSLPNNFSAVFINEAPIEDVLLIFQPISGGTANIIVPDGYEPVITGNATWACLEKKLGTQDYYLLGNLTETP